jgi:hypothetical protein
MSKSCRLLHTIAAVNACGQLRTAHRRADAHDAVRHKECIENYDGGRCQQRLESSFASHTTVHLGLARTAGFLHRSKSAVTHLIPAPDFFLSLPAIVCAPSPNILFSTLPAAV